MDQEQIYGVFFPFFSISQICFCFLLQSDSRRLDSPEECDLFEGCLVSLDN